MPPLPSGESLGCHIHLLKWVWYVTSTILKESFDFHEESDGSLEEPTGFLVGAVGCLAIGCLRESTEFLEGSIGSLRHTLIS